MRSRATAAIRGLRPSGLSTRELAVDLARPESLTLGALVLAVLLWAVSIDDIDPGAMTDLGLLSVLPIAIFVALGVLTVSFMTLAYARSEHTALLAAHLAALIVILHATPQLAYGTLRYSWSWKHLGIVDYIQRRGEVTPDITFLDIYHSFPGFFAFAAVLQDLSGLDDLRTLAGWAPTAFTLIGAAGVVFVFSSLTADRRILWLGAWIYASANWVGQEYFSPQAFGFVLYLFAIGIVLRWLRPSGPGALHLLPRRLHARMARGVETDHGAALDPRARAGLVAVTLILVAAIVTSHPLTSIMVVFTLTALVVAGCCRFRALPLAAAAMVAVWAATFARHYVGKNIGSTLGSVALPWTTTEANLVNTTQVSADQALVATISRGFVVAMVCLAGLGAARLFSRRALDPAPVVLALVPTVLFATGDYDGELIFRIYLFSVPFLAFLAAHALPSRDGSRRSWPAARASALAGLLLVAFLFSYYGKDRQYYFTPQEVAAAEEIYRSAPPGSLLIQGTTNVPTQFLNYENFTYVTISAEPPETQARIRADPPSVLEDWMSDERYGRAYLLITRSQKVDVESLGAMAPGSLDRIEDALSASPRFRVVRTPVSMIATLKPFTCEDIPAGAGPHWYDGSLLDFACPRPERPGPSASG